MLPNTLEPQEEQYYTHLLQRQKTYGFIFYPLKNFIDNEGINATKCTS